MNSWEKWNYPTYFFQASDVPQKYLRKSNTQDAPSATVYDVVTESKIAEKAAVEYASDAPAHLAGLTRIIFGAMDAWFEEEEQIFVHPKDPYKVWCHVQQKQPFSNW